MSLICITQLNQRHMNLLSPPQCELEFERRTIERRAESESQDYERRLKVLACLSPDSLISNCLKFPFLTLSNGLHHNSPVVLWREGHSERLTGGWPDSVCEVHCSHFVPRGRLRSDFWLSVGGRPWADFRGGLRAWWFGNLWAAFLENLNIERWQNRNWHTTHSSHFSSSRTTSKKEKISWQSYKKWL